MKIESQKSNHKSGFIVLSVLLSYLLFVEAHLYNEYYDDNYQLARRHISSDHNNETSYYDGSLGASTIKAASRFEQLVLEGSTVRLVCPHAQPGLWGPHKFATNKHREFQLPTRTTIQPNHKQGRHRRVKVANTYPVSRRTLQGPEEEPQQQQQHQVKWFRNHVPLQLNPNYFLSHRRPTVTTTTTTTTTTETTMAPLEARKVYHSGPETLPLGLEDITSRLSELNQTDEQIVDAVSFEGQARDVGQADRQLAALENVNELHRGRKLFKSSRRGSAGYQEERQHQATFLDGNNRNQNADDDGVDSLEAPLDEQWHVNKYGELVIPGVSRRSAGLFTCVWQGEVSELLLDVLSQENGDDSNGGHEEDRKQLTEVSSSPEGSILVSGGVEADKNSDEKRHPERDNREVSAKQKKSTLEGDYFSRQISNTNSVAWNAKPDNQDQGDNSGVVVSSPKGVVSWIDEATTTTHQSGPARTVKTQRAEPVEFSVGAQQPAGGDDIQQDQDLMSMRQRTLPTNTFRASKQLQARPAKRRPVHLVETEIVSANDLALIPGLLYTKQQFHCPALRQADLWSHLNAQMIPLIKAFCLDTRDPSQHHLDELEILRCHSLARRLILRLIRGGCRWSNHGHFGWATSTANEAPNDLACQESETSVLDVVWFKDGQRLAFDGNGKGLEPNPNVKLIDLLHQYSLAGVKVEDGERLAAGGNNLEAPGAGLSVVSEGQTSGLDGGAQSTTSGVNSDSLSQSWPPRGLAGMRAAKTTTTTSRLIPQGNMKNNNYNNDDNNNHDSKEEEEEATGTRTLEMKWPACPLRGMTLEIDGIRRDNGGRYTCALELSLEKLADILAGLRRLNEPSSAVKWANCAHDNDKSWRPRDEKREETEGGVQVEEQRSWRGPRSATLSALEGPEKYEPLVVASNQKTAKSSPVGPAGDKLQGAPIFGPRWPRASGAQIEPINGHEERRSRQQTPRHHGHHRHHNNKGPKQQQQQPSGAPIDEAIVLALGESMQLQERAHALESILNGSATSEKSLSYIEQVVLMSNSSLPLTTLQSFSLIVSERPADSCSVWSTIREADDAYSRRKLADFKRLKRGQSAASGGQAERANSLSQIKATKRRREEDKYLADNSRPGLQSSQTDYIDRSSANSNHSAAAKAGGQSNSIDYSTNSNGESQPNVQESRPLATGSAGTSNVEPRNANHGINEPKYSGARRGARDQNNAIDDANLAMARSGGLQSSSSAISGGQLATSVEPRVEPFNYANERNLGLRSGGPDGAVIADSIDVSSEESTHRRWHHSTMDSLRRWLPMLSFKRLSRQVMDDEDGEHRQHLSETKGLITNADHPQGNNILLADQAGPSELVRSRRKRSSGQSPDRVAEQSQLKAARPTTLVGSSSSSSSSSSGLTNRPAALVIDDSEVATNSAHSAAVIDSKAGRQSPLGRPAAPGDKMKSTGGPQLDRLEVTPTTIHGGGGGGGQTNREVDFSGPKPGEGEEEEEWPDKRHDPSRGHKSQPTTTLPASRYDQRDNNHDRDDVHSSLAGEEKPIEASGHSRDKSAKGLNGATDIQQVAGQLNEAENSISRSASANLAAHHIRRQISLQEASDLSDQLQETTTTTTRTTTTAANDGSLIGSSSSSSTSSSPGSPWLMQASEEDDDEALLWTAGQYLYLHLRAFAALSLYGVQVEVEWSNERVNGTNNIDFALDGKTNNNNQQQQQPTASPGPSLVVQSDNNGQSNGSAGATSTMTSTPTASNVDQFARSHGPSPFATIDLVPGQNLHLECTAQALGRLPDVRWYKRIEAVPSHLADLAKNLQRQIGPDLYWPLTAIDLLDDDEPTGAGGSSSSSSPRPSSSRSFVCSQSITIFDNLGKQTFTVVNGLQLSQYNDDPSWSPGRSRRSASKPRKRRGSPLDGHDDHYNLYACIVDADVRHSYATLGVHFRQTASGLPVELRNRLQVRSMLDEVRSSTGANYVASAGMAENDDDNEDHQLPLATGNYNFLRESHLNFPMGSFWIPIKNGSYLRSPGDDLIGDNLVPSMTITPAILSVIIVFVFSSLLALVYLTLKSYQALTNFQVDGEQLNADLIAEQQQSDLIGQQQQQPLDEMISANVDKMEPLNAAMRSDRGEHLMIADLAQSMALDCSCGYRQQEQQVGGDNLIIDANINEEATTPTGLMATNHQAVFAESGGSLNELVGEQTGSPFSRSVTNLLAPCNASHLKDYAIFDSTALVDESHLYAHNLQHSLLYDVHYHDYESFECRNATTSPPGARTALITPSGQFNQVDVIKPSGDNPDAGRDLVDEQQMVPGDCCRLESSGSKLAFLQPLVEQIDFDDHQSQFKRSKVNMIENPLNSDSFDY